MFKLAVFLAAVVAINASGYGRPAYRADYSAPKPYSFGYDAVGGGGASSRRESGDGAGNVRGSYSLAVADGRRRVVDYVADGAGFRANVRTNEPGTDNQDPADVKVSAAPAPVVVKTVKVAPSYAYGTGYGYGAGYRAGFGGYRGGYGGYGLGGYGGYGLGGYGGYGLGGYGGYGLGGYGGYGYGGYGLGGGYGRSYSRSYNRGGYHW